MISSAVLHMYEDTDTTWEEYSDAPYQYRLSTIRHNGELHHTIDNVSATEDLWHKGWRKVDITSHIKRWQEHQVSTHIYLKMELIGDTLNSRGLIFTQHIQSFIFVGSPYEAPVSSRRKRSLFATTGTDSCYPEAPTNTTLTAQPHLTKCCKKKVEISFEKAGPEFSIIHMPRIAIINKCVGPCDGEYSGFILDRLGHCALMSLIYIPHTNDWAILIVGHPGPMNYAELRPLQFSRRLISKTVIFKIMQTWLGSDIWSLKPSSDRDKTSPRSSANIRMYIVFISFHPVSSVFVANQRNVYARLIGLTSSQCCHPQTYGSLAVMISGENASLQYATAETCTCSNNW